MPAPVALVRLGGKQGEIVHAEHHVLSEADEMMGSPLLGFRRLSVPIIRLCASSTALRLKGACMTIAIPAVATQFTLRHSEWIDAH